MQAALITNYNRYEGITSQHAKEAAASRAETWKELEKARAEGKCRFIGVSNYSVPLLAEMESYASVMPAVNQLGPDSIEKIISSQNSSQFSSQNSSQNYT